MDGFTMDIGRRIHRARKRANMNQGQLAEAIGKTLRTVQNYESGAIEPSLTVIREIAHVLKTTPSELTGIVNKDIHIENLGDFLKAICELQAKDCIRFEIETDQGDGTSPKSCAIKFYADDNAAALNSKLCFVLEQFKEMREKLESQEISNSQYKSWIASMTEILTSVKLEVESTECIRDQLKRKMRNL